VSKKPRNQNGRAQKPQRRQHSFSELAIVPGICACCDSLAYSVEYPCGTMVATGFNTDLAAAEWLSHLQNPDGSLIVFDDPETDDLVDLVAHLAALSPEDDLLKTDDGFTPQQT